MKIGIAADHGGFELKQIIQPFLLSLNYEVIDFGAYEQNNLSLVHKRLFLNLFIFMIVTVYILFCEKFNKQYVEFTSNFLLRIQSHYEFGKDWRLVTDRGELFMLRNLK